MAEEAEVKTPTYEDIYIKVTDIVTNHLCINEDETGFDTSFPFESFGADDLDHDELIMQVEDAFNIEFDDAECANVHNTQDLIRIVAAAYNIEVPENIDIEQDDENDAEYTDPASDDPNTEAEVQESEDEPAQN